MESIGPLARSVEMNAGFTAASGYCMTDTKVLR